MGFLRRMLGGSKEGDDAGGSAGEPGTPGTPESPGSPGAPGTPGSPGAPGDAALDEVERDRELLRAEAQRLDDDLIQRQLRYADRAWTPPAQGGTRRAEDGDKPAG